MVYQSLCRIIAGLCHHSTIPLTPKEISRLLWEVVDEEMVELVCRYMCEDGKLVRVLNNSYTLRRLAQFAQFNVNILVSSEYQKLGMQLLETELDSCSSSGTPSSLVRYIPFDCEHRFLEIRPSTIGPAAGAGLFIRHNRRIPQGCVFCEYKGRSLRSLSRKEDGDKDALYVVYVRQTSTFIDGVTAEGEHLSLATFINDNGPRCMNAGMVEYSKYPGRVFIVAARDIDPGEEVFVLYGPKYWGFRSYSDQKLQATDRNANGSSRRKRARVSDEYSLKDDPYPCEFCGDNVLRRTLSLHKPHCGDCLTSTGLHHLDCMPRSTFTTIESQDQVIPARRMRAKHKAECMVNWNNAQTFAHTHVDAVGDREISFFDIGE